MSRLSSVLLAAACALAFAGCTMGPDFHRPQAPDVSRYLMSGDDAVSSGAVFVSAPQQAAAWWHSFQSPELNAVMVKALAGNQDLAKANATLAEVEAQEQTLGGSSWPSLDANAGAHRQRINTTAFGFSGFPSHTISLYSIGGAIAYDFDLFGERHRRLESASARTEEETHRAQAAYLTLTGRVAQQVIEIASLRAQIEAANAVIKDDKDNLEVVRRAIKAGGAASMTSISADAQLARDLAELPPLEQRLSEARHGLALLVGEAPAAWTAPDFDLASIQSPQSLPVSLPSELVRRRPDILAAEAAFHSALADIGVAVAERFPKISLTAELTQGAVASADLFKDSASGWAIGPGITNPLFHGGALSANERAKRAAADAMLAAYRQTVLQAFVQIADLLEALQHDQQRVDALQSAEVSAADNLVNARLAFEQGGGAFINVLDAQRQHNQAARNLATAEGTRLSDIALLYVATASDWRERQVASEPVKP